MVYLTVLRATLHNGNAHDHEIVKAPETHPKDVPKTKETEFCVVTGLQG